MSHDHSHSHAHDPGDESARRAIRLSLIVAVLMLVGKVTAALVTGSDAILSDAAESVVHIVATGVAAVSLWYAAQPPDRQHPYGHGKVAYFSAGLEGALIAAAAVSIFAIAGRSLWLGPSVEQLGVGLALTGGLAAVNLALGVYLLRVGKKEKNLVVEANGRHVLADMWTSAGVVGGVLLVWATDIVWLDPVVAIAVAAHILWTGGRLMKDSWDGLMDAVAPEETEALTAVLERAVTSGAISGFHKLQHRRVTNTIYIDVHLLVPDELTVRDAHARASGVEADLSQVFPEDLVQVTSHIEPRDHEAAHPDGHAL